MEINDMLTAYSESLAADQRNKYVAVAGEFIRHGGRGLDKESVLRYLSWMRKEGYADGTIDWKYRAVLRFLKIGGIAVLIHKSDRPKINQMSVYAPGLKPELIGRMIGAAKAGAMPPQDAAYLALSTVFGLRRTELAALTPERVNLRKGLLYIETAKSGRQRYHIIPGEIRPVLESGVKHLRPRTPQSVTLSFLRAERIAGIRHPQEVGWHSIRRTVVRTLLQAGISDATVTNFMRWRDGGQMSRRYFNLTEVGEGDSAETVQHQPDADVDEAVFARHPFLGRSDDARIEGVTTWRAENAPLETRSMTSI